MERVDGLNTYQDTEFRVPMRYARMKSFSYGKGEYEFREIDDPGAEAFTQDYKIVRPLEPVMPFNEYLALMLAQGRGASIPMANCVRVGVLSPEAYMSFQEYQNEFPDAEIHLEERGSIIDGSIELAPYIARPVNDLKVFARG